MLMSDLVVNLTARGRESHNLALFPCTVTGSSIDLDLHLNCITVDASTVTYMSQLDIYGDPNITFEIATLYCSH